MLFCFSPSSENDVASTRRRWTLSKRTHTESCKRQLCKGWRYLDIWLSYGGSLMPACWHPENGSATASRSPNMHASSRPTRTSVLRTSCSQTAPLDHVQVPLCHAATAPEIRCTVEIGHVGRTLLHQIKATKPPSLFLAWTCTQVTYTFDAAQRASRL